MVVVLGLNEALPYYIHTYKLSEACYAVWRMFHIRIIDILKSIYFAYFHSIIKYGILFWDNSSNSKNIFILKKESIRIVAGVRSRNSCWCLFKRSKILSLPHEYTISLMNFIGNKQEHFQTNTAAYSVNIKNKHHLHRSTANCSCFKKSAYYTSIKIFNSLPYSLQKSYEWKGTLLSSTKKIQKYTPILLCL
jgi:hypothetical protein